MATFGSIDVRSESPYEVSIIRGGDEAVRLIAAVTPKAQRYVVIHQPALADKAHQVEADLIAAGKDVSLLELADAEAGKTLDSAGRCWDACAAAGLTRQDAIVGLGGGAATDLAGFIAATWMRGIDVVHYPTTLLAMVDAAVGGKTGINTSAGKNLVGCFHEPAGVIIDLDVLDTLPREELIAGSAEIIKAGFIADTEILDIYEADPAAALDPAGALPELIHRAIKVKADVVSQDLKEASLREILNYGHTYGHAVEHQENYLWRHGQAVAVGMVFEAELAAAAGQLDRQTVERHRTILESIGLATHYDGADLDTLIDVMGRDKKNKAGVLRFVTITEPGHPTRLEAPGNQLLRQAFEATQAP